MANPQIEQIRLSDNLYDINVKKDWAENNEAAVGFIENRTHYKVVRKGTELYTTDNTGNATTKYITAHQFYNGYLDPNNDQNYTRNYTDIWVPAESWVEANKAFDISVWANANSSAISKEIVLSENDDGTTAIFEDTISGWKLFYESATKQFHVDGDIVNPQTLRTAYFKVELKVCNKETAESQQYNYTITQPLDSQYIPIDSKTITVNSEGKLQADNTYEREYLYVAEQFGKYAPKSRIYVLGKSVQDVIDDAFCTDKAATIDSTPSITLTLSPDKNVDETSNDIYELGETVKGNWTLTFNRGKYTYGMVDRSYKKLNATSDLYPTKLTLDWQALGDTTVQETNFTEEAANWNTNKWGTTHRFTGSFEYTLPSDTVITSALTATATVDFEELQDENGYFGFPATILGDRSVSNEAEVRKKMRHNANEGQAKLTTKASKIKSTYRWFWLFNEAGENLYLSDLLENKIFKRDAYFPTVKKLKDFSKLGGFPEKVMPYKMQQAYFLAPANTINSVTLQDINLGISAGSVLKTTCTVMDPQDNPHDYDIFYINNEDSTYGANEYKVVIS